MAAMGGVEVTAANVEQAVLQFYRSSATQVLLLFIQLDLTNFLLSIKYTFYLFLFPLKI